MDHYHDLNNSSMISEAWNWNNKFEHVKYKENYNIKYIQLEWKGIKPEAGTNLVSLIIIHDYYNKKIIKQKFTFEL